MKKSFCGRNTAAASTTSHRLHAPNATGCAAGARRPLRRRRPPLPSRRHRPPPQSARQRRPRGTPLSGPLRCWASTARASSRRQAPCPSQWRASWVGCGKGLGRKGCAASCAVGVPEKCGSGATHVCPILPSPKRPKARRRAGPRPPPLNAPRTTPSAPRRGEPQRNRARHRGQGQPPQRAGADGLPAHGGGVPGPARWVILSLSHSLMAEPYGYVSGI